MPAKKLSWFVAAAHADDRVDIFSTSDYERAHEVASALWQEECPRYQSTKKTELVDVTLFDKRGRVLWSAIDEPSGLGTTGYIEDVKAAGLVRVV